MFEKYFEVKTVTILVFIVYSDHEMLLLSVEGYSFYKKAKSDETGSHRVALAVLELCRSDHTGLKLRDPSATASGVLELEMYTTMPGLLYFYDHLLKQ
ncbi:hypothetical protein I79_021060 [Cricetulus griseus]|uniref:Uncharacterized protein n=1 Tax=Cricetulus griseus TaxID=10029 RepID=G3IBM9_CRIGR|nr:hypothetical protein I79_021060 [Cricetulus griseus]